MSEPSPWGPPRTPPPPRPPVSYPAPTGRPPSPYPQAPPQAQPPRAPTAHLPTDHLPTTPMHAVGAPDLRRPTPTRRMAPDPGPYEDEYQDDYRDDSRSDTYRADPPRRDDDYDDYPERRPRRRRPRPRHDPDDYDDGPRRRGQVFSALVLLLALVVSALLYVLTYQILVSVEVLSGDPLGGVGGQAATWASAALGALVVFVLALIAFVVAKPKTIAMLGLTASLLLPVVAVILGFVYGGSVLRQNVEDDIASATPEIASRGAEAATDAIVDELQRRGLDIGPVRDLVDGVLGG